MILCICTYVYIFFFYVCGVGSYPLIFLSLWILRKHVQNWKLKLYPTQTGGSTRVCTMCACVDTGSVCNATQPSRMQCNVEVMQCLFVRLSICASVCLAACLPGWLAVCLSVCLFAAMRLRVSKEGRKEGRMNEWMDGWM